MPSTKAIIEGLSPHRGGTEKSEPRHVVYSCSVWEAFDEMQLCYTLSPQLKNYYRFGSFKDCSHLKQKFNACLNSKRMSNEDSQRVLQEVYDREQERMQIHGKDRPTKDIWKVMYLL